jgi:hypothetical protein
MRALLVPRKFLQQTIFIKPLFRMGSLHARELRTLAQCSQLAISAAEDDVEIRSKYRPFLLSPEVEATDWISQLELETTISMSEADLKKTGKRLRVLVLYGSLRARYILYTLLQQTVLIDSKFILQTNGIRGLPHPPPSRLRCPNLQSFSPPHSRVRRRLPSQRPRTTLPLSLVRWAYLVLARATRKLNCRLQEPNRLDPSLHRLGPSHSRSDPLDHTGQWRESEF